MPTFPVSTSLNEDLVLPITGSDGTVREYTIKVPRAAEMVQISAMNTTLIKALAGRIPTGSDTSTTDLGVADTQRILLGQSVFDAMMADGISGPDLQLAVQTVNIWVMSNCDDEKALEHWLGKAPAVKTPSDKTGAAAPTTRRRNSGNGTNSRKTTS